LIGLLPRLTDLAKPHGLPNLSCPALGAILVVDHRTSILAMPLQGLF